MKRLLIGLATLFALAGSAQSQDVYGGLGLPGLFTLGIAQPMGGHWGMRGEYATGLSATGSGSDSGVSYDISIKSSRAGLYADWFPFGGGFRLVGGITANDMKFELNALGSGTATINGKTVNMSGHYFNVNMKYPSTTPYLGVGYGHHSLNTKGLGFYADVGITFGTYAADVSSDLVNVSGITQADVDAQKQQMNDSLAGYKYLPSVSLGLVYRY